MKTFLHFHNKRQLPVSMKHVALELRLSSLKAEGGELNHGPGDLYPWQPHITSWAKA